MLWMEVQKSALFIINFDFAANIQLIFEITKISLFFVLSGVLLFAIVLIFLEGDAFVEFLVAFATFEEEVEADIDQGDRSKTLGLFAIFNRDQGQILF